MDSFQITRGRDILGFLGNDSPMDGFLQSARDYDWEVIPGVDYRANPSGLVDDDIFERFWVELLEYLEPALSRGIEAIFLVLHGAMATENQADPEGELLKRIRLLPGAQELLLFAVLDSHANVSERMARNASALITYRENPHTDARETAVRAANHLRRALDSKKSLRNYFRHSRLLLAPPSTGTADSPMRELEDLARQLEQLEGHWEVGVASGFAHADTPDTGLSFWVVSDQPETACIKTLDLLLEKACLFVKKLRPHEWELSAALDQISEARIFPALLIEPADNIGGGGPGDATFILRALLERPFARGGIIINDPESIQLLRQHSPGQTVSISLGGKGARLDQGPVELEVTLERLTDGRFELEDKKSHLAALAGSHISMGLCAVVVHRHLTILITSRATAPLDLGQWRSQGIAPEKLEIIGIKAAVAHRGAYDPIAASSYTVSTPGPCSSDLYSLPYRKLRRPIYPLDP